MLSVFVPSYNHSNYIIECLANIQNISVDHKMIYIIDDASTDDSVKKIENYISDSSDSDNIVFIKKGKNKGVIDSLNLFLSIVETEYVYLMSSDDITIPHGVERLVYIMENNKSLKFVIGGGNNLFSNGVEKPFYTLKHDKFFKLSATDRYPKIFLDCPSPILSQSSIIRTSALRFIGGWDSKIIADDYLMFMKLFVSFPEKGSDFEYCPDIDCVKYRHHGSNSYQKFERQLTMTVQAIESIAPNYLKNRAIGYKLSYYSLYCFSKYRFKQGLSLFLLVPGKSWYWAVEGMLRKFFVKLIEKCKT